MALRSLNKRISANNALDLILNGEVSDFSDLSSDEDDQNVTLPERDALEEPLSEVEGEDEDEDETDEDGSCSGDSEADQELEAGSSASKHLYRWRKRDIPYNSQSFDDSFDVSEMKSPLEYFKLFWTNEITELVVQNSNLYHTQALGTSLCTTAKEIEQYIGIQMIMGVVHLPAYPMYWSKETRYAPIADIMSLKRFQKIRKYLHFVDNLSYDDEAQSAGGKLFKIQPVIDLLRQQCTLIPPEEKHSIDEQIIPSKTKFSGIRQYNPKKPVKWGFKNLVRAGSSGFMYDFYIYTGKSSSPSTTAVDYEDLQKSAQVVARLCKGLPGGKGHQVIFDNWFTTVELMLYLKKKDLLACGTMRSNRIKRCKLDTNKDLKEKQGRGGMDFKSDLNSGIVIVKWLDNNAVHLISNFVGIEPTSSVERWCPKDKARKPIKCPQIVKTYNSGMGGVDLADMLISLYRITVKCRRWYIKIFWHMVDIAKVNAWLFYRRCATKSGINKKHQLTLLKFIVEVSSGLTKENVAAMPRSVGRPSKRRVSEDVETRGRKAFIPNPSEDAKFDQVGHWPEIRSNAKGRCRYCKAAHSRMYCAKCNVSLCCTGERNCFQAFHHK